MRKKIVALGTALMMLVGAFPLVSYAVDGEYPGNYEDNEYSFSFPSEYVSRYAATQNLAKYNNTSVYMKCESCITLATVTSGTGSVYNGTAYGAEKSNSTAFNCVYNSKSAPTYSFTKGTVQRMTNYIYEAGYSFANVYCASPKYTYQVKYTGKWSPDSV